MFIFVTLFNMFLRNIPRNPLNTLNSHFARKKVTDLFVNVPYQYDTVLIM